MNFRSPQPVEKKLRVALAGDCELVNAGLASVLAAHADRVCLAPVESAVEIDVILFDPMLVSGQGLADLRHWTERGARVVVYSWSLEAAARRVGQVKPDDFLSKAATAAQIVACVERVAQTRHAGRFGDPHLRDITRAADRVELTYREAEVLTSIVQGLSNGEICRRDFVTINTLKSHVRHLYRKIGVTRRSQAVLWGIQNGYLVQAQTDATAGLPLAQ